MKENIIIFIASIFTILFAFFVFWIIRNDMNIEQGFLPSGVEYDLMEDSSISEEVIGSIYYNSDWDFSLDMTENWSDYVTKISTSTSGMRADIIDFCVNVSDGNSYSDEVPKGHICLFRILIYGGDQWDKEAKPCLDDRDSQAMCGWVDTVLDRRGGQIFTYGGAQDYPDKYHYLMEETSEILETFRFDDSISRDMHSSDEYRFYVSDLNSDSLVYSVRKGGENFLVLEKGEEKIVIDKGKADYEHNNEGIGDVWSFRDPVFSDNGRYVFYKKHGWEWVVGVVYDIEKKSELLDFFGFGKGELINFNGSDYFFLCNSNGMASENDGKVYKLPEADLKFDLLSNISEEKMKNFSGVDCSYSDSEGEIIFELKGYDKHGGEDGYTTPSSETKDSITYSVE